MKTNVLSSVFLITLLTVPVSIVQAEPYSEKAVSVGVATILSGDLAVGGENSSKTIETYKKNRLRHKIKFIFEDAKLSSRDGLTAYRKLIDVDKVDLILAVCTSNGTLAAKQLVNSTKTPTISVSTGGYNVDKAGPYFFRIGNSDTLNGTQQADYFIEHGLKRVALLAEETEYTQDIARFFVEQFKNKGGQLVYNQNFLPGDHDFLTAVAAIRKSNAQAIFMPTQTGTALGVFLKQWNAHGGDSKIPVHTTFVAAPNQDAHEVAGDLIYGTYYMAPAYDRRNSDLIDFFRKFEAEHGKPPPIAFHAAGIVDALDLLQKYLDNANQFNAEDFRRFLLSKVENYPGFLGTISFDQDGNTKIGFQIASIERR